MLGVQNCPHRMRVCVCVCVCACVWSRGHLHHKGRGFFQRLTKIVPSGQQLRSAKAMFDKEIHVYTSKHAIHVQTGRRKQLNWNARTCARMHAHTDTDTHTHSDICYYFKCGYIHDTLGRIPHAHLIQSCPLHTCKKYMYNGNLQITRRET